MPGSLQAGLLVLQAAPSASGAQRKGILAAASSQHSAAVAAPASAPMSDDAAALSAPSASELIPLYTPQVSRVSDRFMNYSTANNGIVGGW